MSGITRTENGPFTRRSILWTAVVGLIAFGGLLVLSAYGPDFGRSRNGGAHPLSISGIGYKGLVDLIGYAGGTAKLLRSDKALGTENLLILTPTETSDPTKIAAIVNKRRGKPTLIVLPKWRTRAMPAHPGWVQRVALNNADVERRLLSAIDEPAIRDAKLSDVPGTNGRVERVHGVDDLAPLPTFTLADPGRRIAGKGLDPLLVDDKGLIVMAGAYDRRLYVLADPDMLANHGIADPRVAHAVMMMLDELNSGGADAIEFDLTLNGFGQSKNLLKLAFDPPFLALTLSLLAVALLIGVHAAARFGPAVDETRAVAFGKLALVENIVALLVSTRRRASLGARYDQLTREAVASVTGAPHDMGDEALTAYLDSLGDTAGRYSKLADDALLADDHEDLVAAARALYFWRKEYVREG